MHVSISYLFEIKVSLVFQFRCWLATIHIAGYWNASEHAVESSAGRPPIFTLCVLVVAGLAHAWDGRPGCRLAVAQTKACAGVLQELYSLQVLV